MVLPDDVKNLEIKDIFTSTTVHFYLLLSQDCNLNCSFCYQPKSFRSKNKEMTWEILEKTVNFALDNIPEEKLKFVFYGGEPLMNFEMLKKAVLTYPQLRFVLVTNGVLITPEIRDFLIKHKGTVYTSISIANSKDCFPDKWKELMKNALDVIRACKGDVHYVEGNPKVIYETYLYLESLNLGLIRLSIPRGMDFTEEEYAEYINQYKMVCDHVYFGENYNRDRINFDRAFNCNLARKFQEVPYGSEEKYCGCGILYMAVDCDGNFWGCDWLKALNKIPLGSLDKGFNMENLRYIKSYQKEPYKRLYIHCDETRLKGICHIPETTLCTRAMCIAENIEGNNEVTRPITSHCRANNIDYDIYEYILTKCKEKGLPI
jgi:uncharacterized protein